MEAFHTHTGIGVPLRRSNVDTDQIIPAVYLKRVTRTGFEDGLFAAWRNDPSFILNLSPSTGVRFFWSPDPTSAPARRVSMRSGRSWTSDSGSSSRPVSPTSFAATRARPDCWRLKSLKMMLNFSGSSSSRIRGGWKSLSIFKIEISPRERPWCRSRLTITQLGDCWKVSTISALRCGNAIKSKLSRPPARVGSRVFRRPPERCGTPKSRPKKKGVPTPLDSPP